MCRKHCGLVKILCGAAIGLSLCLTSCVSTSQPVDFSRINMNDVSLDVADMSESLLGELAFDDTLAPMEEDIAAALLNIGGLYNAMSAHGSTGATAEMLVILRCESATDAETAAAHLATYRDEMAAVYAGYNMVESEKLTKSVLNCKGRYVFFCVSPDSGAANAAYESYVVQSLKQ